MYINIDNSDDPNYRYKMPKVISTLVKGATQITNIEKIAKSLDRDSDQIIKFIALQNNSHVVKNSIKGNIQDIQKTIFEYIDLFVICEKCGNPETKQEVKKDNLFLRCGACSHKTYVKDHKLIKFIISRIE